MGWKGGSKKGGCPYIRIMERLITGVGMFGKYLRRVWQKPNPSYAQTQVGFLGDFYIPK